ncbi:hypothetical protein B0909_24710 [Rhizobium rhizogenes]|nr:hypothetical protein B0909_24710 [Rhizobium rhizogenes]
MRYDSCARLLLRHAGLDPASSRRASARREEFFSPRTWAGWTPDLVRGDGVRMGRVCPNPRLTRRAMPCR